jgi:glyoxylase-like metal-dependent hydrolase (beta-lactamase superfamily II)
VTEAELAAVGVHRLPIPIPFVQAGGPVNVYAIEEAAGGLLLFDSGLGTPEAQAALEGGLRALGRRLDEVTRIVVSHGHVDHYGAARFVQERHGGEVPVLVHPADAGKISEAGPSWRDRAPVYAAYLARQGVPSEVVEVVSRAGERSFSLARRVGAVQDLREGDLLRTRELALEVLHMPGHTPGLVCLYDRARRLFFSDDHLLAKVSPNPLIDLGPDGQDGAFRPLIAYLGSLERTRALEIELVLPGHGPPFSGHREVIDGLLAFYRKRQARIGDLLAEAPRSAYEISRALWPAARPGDTFLTLSETIANLEVMQDRGEVARDEERGRYRYRPTVAPPG